MVNFYLHTTYQIGSTIDGFQSHDMLEALGGKTVGQHCCLDKHGWNLEVDEILGAGRSWLCSSCCCLTKRLKWFNNNMWNKWVTGDAKEQLVALI